uniref:Uncharacterized protein n=1 Tax=Anguilla anguilla TaxID=7936 RepID=A0A0E9RFE0_ANGAN
MLPKRKAKQGKWSSF